MNQFIKIYGFVLVLSGLGHSAGVLNFYMTEGVPDANRVLLDIWIAEALFLGGGLLSIFVLLKPNRVNGGSGL